MGTREDLLNKVRERADHSGSIRLRKAEVARRIKNSTIGIQPDLRLTKSKAVTRFIEKAIAADATAVQCKADEVPKQVIHFLQAHNLPSKLRTGTDKFVKACLNDAPKTLEIDVGVAEENDLVAMSRAVAGVGETGTLILTSGRENPTRNNFLPENHIVLVRQKDIELFQEEVWKKLRQEFGFRKLPRTVNMITGPSRSADIEQTLILGAHGPVRLHILVVR